MPRCNENPSPSRKSPYARLHPYRLLIALAAVMALVAPIRPAIASAAPLDTAIAAVEPAVVQIDTTIDYQHAIGAGTGFLLNPNGEVLTNFHVVQGADVVTAHNVGTGQSFGADLVGYDRTHDIALLQLRGASGLPVAPLGQLGDSCRRGARGGASATRIPGGPPTREAGTVTQLDRTIEAKDALTGSIRRADRPDRGRGQRPRRRLRWPARERRGTGDRRDHGRDRELPVRAGRQGLRDPDQPGAGHRRPDPGAGAVRHGAHRAAHAARRRCCRRRSGRRRARRRHPRGAARRSRRGCRSRRRGRPHQHRRRAAGFGDHADPACSIGTTRATSST